MKEIKGNKASSMGAIKRRMQKQAAQKHSCGEVNEQIFSGVMNKDTFGPTTATYFPRKEGERLQRLAPLGSNGWSE